MQVGDVWSVTPRTRTQRSAGQTARDVGDDTAVLLGAGRRRWRNGRKRWGWRWRWSACCTVAGSVYSVVGMLSLVWCIQLQAPTRPPARLRRFPPRRCSRGEDRSARASMLGFRRASASPDLERHVTGLRRARGRLNMVRRAAVQEQINCTGRCTTAVPASGGALGARRPSQRWRKHLSTRVLGATFHWANISARTSSLAFGGIVRPAEAWAGSAALCVSAWRLRWSDAPLSARGRVLAWPATAHGGASGVVMVLMMMCAHSPAGLLLPRPRPRRPRARARARRRRAAAALRCRVFRLVGLSSSWTRLRLRQSQPRVIGQPQTCRVCPEHGQGLEMGLV
jgi:hypothetical protein